MNTNSDSYKQPRCVADALELGLLNDHDDSQAPELYRQLYRHARNEDGKRELIEGNPSFKKGWIDLGKGHAKALVSAFIAQDDNDDLKYARRIAKNNLEAVPWNNVLGINDPPIQLKIKIHGNKWAARFQSSAPAMRGAEQINEDLPPIPDSPLAKQSNDKSKVNAQAVSKPQTQQVDSSANPLEDILKLGGMPA